MKVERPRTRDESFVRTGDLQSVLIDRVYLLCPRVGEHDIMSRMRQPAAQIAAYCARAHNQNPLWTRSSSHCQLIHFVVFPFQGTR